MGHVDGNDEHAAKATWLLEQHDSTFHVDSPCFVGRHELTCVVLTNLR